MPCNWHGGVGYVSSCANMMGAFAFLAASRNMFLMEAFWYSPIMTGVRGLMIPAFCAAISSRVLPRIFM